MTRKEFRIRALQQGLFIWEVAQAAGVAVYTLNRWLKETPISDEHQTQIDAAFDKLRNEKQVGA